jgi:hypothetical protein
MILPDVKSSTFSGALLTLKENLSGISLTGPLYCPLIYTALSKPELIN